MGVSTDWYVTVSIIRLANYNVTTSLIYKLIV